MRRSIKWLGSLIAGAGALALVGCGGTAEGTLPAAATKSQGAGPTLQGNAIFQLVVGPPGHTSAAGKRRPAYVSPASRSVTIAINGKSVEHDIGPKMPGCTQSDSATITCSIAAEAPVGTDHFAFNVYDQAGGGGSLLSEAAMDYSIDGSPENIPVLLKGVVHAISVIAPDYRGPCGLTAPGAIPPQIPVTITATDADGFAIVGPADYDNPIVLTTDDASGSTQLSETTVKSPQDVVTLAYNGARLENGVTVEATAVNVNPNDVVPGYFAPYNERTSSPGITYNYDRLVSANGAPNNFGHQPNPVTVTSISQFPPATGHIAWPAVPQGLCSVNALADYAFGVQGPYHEYIAGVKSGKQVKVYSYGQASITPDTNGQELQYTEPRLIDVLPEKSGTSWSSSPARDWVNTYSAPCGQVTIEDIVDAGGNITSSESCEGTASYAGSDSIQTSIMPASLPASCAGPFASSPEIYDVRTVEIGQNSLGLDVGLNVHIFSGVSPWVNTQDDYTAPGVGVICSVFTQTGTLTTQSVKRRPETGSVGGGGGGGGSGGGSSTAAEVNVLLSIDGAVVPKANSRLRTRATSVGPLVKVSPATLRTIGSHAVTTAARAHAFADGGHS